ncbi:class I SAM-dependent methyltransferase, partial [bacterium]|nr:class I SAM-dependent methyltransferase [bacterium]
TFNKDNKILDIGCANGYFLDKLKEKGYLNLYGADIGNYLKDKVHQHQVVDFNVERLPYDDKSFDLITAFQLLEHLENYFLILQEVHRILKPGGVFIFSVPNQLNIFYRFRFALTGNMVGWSAKNNHLLFLTKDVFQKTFLKDFDLVETFYNKGPLPFIGRLNIVPGLKFKSRTRVLPRKEIFADRVCYVLRKK